MRTHVSAFLLWAVRCKINDIDRTVDYPPSLAWSKLVRLRKPDWVVRKTRHIISRILGAVTEDRNPRGCALAGNVVNKAGYTHAIVDIGMCSAPPSIREAIVCHMNMGKASSLSLLYMTLPGGAHGGARCSLPK